MAPFRFGELNSDIRRIIWEYALLQTSAERIVLLDNQTTDEDSPHNSLRVLPFRSLVSPIMAVNKESRSYARGFYDLVLSVFRLPRIPNTAPNNNINKRHKILHDIEDPDDYWHDSYNMGRVYLSLRHDIFLSGFRLVNVRISDSLHQKWCLSPTSIYGIGATGNHVSNHVKFFTESIWSSRHEIQKALSPWVLVALCNSPYHKLSGSRTLSSESGSLCMRQKDRYWETEVYPLATRYFCWPSVTWRDINGLMKHLFERRPGEPLKPQYRPMELTTVNQVNLRLL